MKKKLLKILDSRHSDREEEICSLEYNVCHAGKTELEDELDITQAYQDELEWVINLIEKLKD